MLGDLNIDFLKCDEHRLTSSFIDTLYSNNVFPLITKPTRVTQSTATLIDHILTNNFDVMGNHKQGILCTDISDHYAIAHVAGNTKIQAKDNTASGLKHDLSQRNIQKFTHEIEQVDWEIVMNLKEAQGAYSEFHALLTKLYNKNFPYKKKNKPYFDRKPWLIPALKESIKVKNKLYINRNKGVNMNEQWSKYKTYRNRLNYLIRAAERQYYQDQISKHKSNLKKSWQIIKTIINKSKYRLSASEFKCNGKTITNRRQISEKFNKFFVNVGSNLTKNIPKSRKDLMDYINHEINECFYVMPVTDEETAKIIASFKDSSAGWDELKPVIMKNIKHCIAKPLTHICNLSFKTGVFTQQLKTANVVPIYKSGDEDIFSNYRPVSVLPVFSKLIERLMYNRLVMFVNNNDLLYRYQFGFQKDKSTYIALLLLVDKITEALDKRECVVEIFLGFSKASDTVNHDILLQKPNLYGVKAIALTWFKDYLTNRIQYVTYNAIKSTKEYITCGVPQGSILGPLLFLLYVNDLAMVSNAFWSVLFADDTSLFISGKDAESMSVTINNDLSKIQKWLYCNKLSLNVSKTHMIFTARNKISTDLDIKINEVCIERVYETKFMGVLVESQLTWKQHIDYTCKKLSKCIGILSKTRKKLRRPSLLTLYYSFAYPYLFCCNQVWGNNYPTVLNKLLLVQKKLVRMITCSPFRAHTEPLMYA